MEEKDLYLPVKTLFASQGYAVYGEVKGVDVIAQLDEELVAIELKKELNLKVILQGTKRQKLTDDVFVAIITPTSRIKRGQAHKDKIHLLKRLGIGLIYVHTRHTPYIATIDFMPKLFDIKAVQRRTKKKKLAICKEIQGRYSDYNQGGTRGAIMTAYKESALRILKTLEDGASHSTKDIRQQTNNNNSTRILYNNHYNWFLHIKKGHYQISQHGHEALIKYHDFLNTILSD